MDFPRDGAEQNPEGEGGIHLPQAEPRSCPSPGCSCWEMGSCRTQPPGFCHGGAVPALRVTRAEFWVGQGCACRTFLGCSSAFGWFVLGWARPRSLPGAVNSRWHSWAELRLERHLRSPPAVLGCPGRGALDQGGSKIPFQVVQGPTNILDVACLLQHFIPVERHPRGARTPPRSWDRAGFGTKEFLMVLPSASPGNVLGAGSHESCSESLGMRELLSLISVGTVTNQVLLSLGGCRKPWVSPCAPGSPRTLRACPAP